MGNSRETEEKIAWWAEAVRYRSADWAEMWAEFKAEGLEPVDLWEGSEPSIPHNNGFRGRLLILPVRKDAKRGIIIVCAGGAFKFKSAHEAKPVAEFFLKAGLNAAVLDYNVDDSPALPEQTDRTVLLAACEDALRAVRYLRVHADELGFLPDKIAISGFSAGGMTSMLAATRYEPGDPASADALARVSSRPDAALLFYGAFSDSAIPGESGYDPARQRKIADTDCLKNLRTDGPPVFLFQTHADDPRCALAYAWEFARYGIPFEIHTFENGPHGGGLFDGKCMDAPLIPHTARWAGLAAEWLEGKGF
jgi:acetyl esterase/lipase